MPPLGADDALFPEERRALCRLEDIPDGGARGFPAPQGGFIGLMAIRQGERVFVYVNSCPHIGTPLDWTPDRFLSRDGRFIVCATHGAEFQIDRRGVPARTLPRRPTGSGAGNGRGWHAVRAA